MRHLERGNASLGIDHGETPGRGRHGLTKNRTW